MAYILTWEKRGVYCKFHGTVSGDELLQCNFDIYGNERFDSMNYQIFDMLEVTKLNIKKSDVHEVAACDGAAAITNPNVKCALVAIDKNALILSKIYQSDDLKSPWKGRSFTTIQEARAWLS